MKISRVLLLLLDSVASLISLILVNGWINRHFLFDSSKLVLLLIVLIIALSVDQVLVFTREIFTTRKVNWTESMEKGSIFIEGAANPHYCLKIYCKVFIMGIFLVLAARLNIYVLFLLIGLIPVDILSYRLLYKELVRRSQLLQEQTSGWQEIASADLSDSLGQPGMRTEQFIPVIKSAHTSSRIIQVTGIIARIMIMVLAVYDFLLKDYSPLSLLLCCLLLPLYFSKLNEIVNGNLSKRDLINSIRYVDQMKDKLIRPSK